MDIVLVRIRLAFHDQTAPPHAAGGQKQTLKTAVRSRKLTHHDPTNHKGASNENSSYHGACMRAVGPGGAGGPVPGLDAGGRQRAAEAAPKLVPVDSLPSDAASSVPPVHNGDCPNFRVNENGTVPFTPKVGQAPHNVDCGPGGCDLPPYRLLPFRQQQQYQQIRGQSGGSPWPTLPAPAAVDLSPIQQQLGRISDVLEDIRRETRGPVAPPSAPACRRPPTPRPLPH